MPSAAFPYYFSTYLGTTLQCTLLKKNKNMNYWTHFSFRMLWFTRKASLSARTPSLIWFQLRLQNVRGREMRGGPTNLFILCKVSCSTSLNTRGHATNHFNFFTVAQLHINIPISSLISIFIKCGMCLVFSQWVTYIYNYTYKSHWCGAHSRSPKLKGLNQLY